MNRRSRTLATALGGLFCLLVTADAAHAYFGPGAGFAVATSAGSILVVLFVGVGLMATWPVRAMILHRKRRKLAAKAMTKRVVILGLDGTDPERLQEYMDQGLMPNFKKLSEKGCFKPLGTTIPSISPVAWSSFQTGSNPGKHNIFDFLGRDPKTYLPTLSSADIGEPSRILKLGKYRIPLGSARTTLLRKGKPFWATLGEKGVFSTVLRVPITFPPEKFNGHLLSAMCAPDLKGSQGTFTHFSTRKSAAEIQEGGMRISVDRRGNRVKSAVSGPENSIKEGAGEMKIPFTVDLDPEKQTGVMNLDGNKIKLKVGETTDWVHLTFKAAPGINVRGIARFNLRNIDPEFDLYMTPINIDPASPALPISHPKNYAPYLAKTFGPYATLGLAEDTWGLNERVIDEKAFLEQCYSIHEERKTMFFNAIEKTRLGCVVCVFDITDRIQHMFMRYESEDHPANVGKDVELSRHAIRDLYVHMDELLGETMEKIGDGTELIVMSDHGFKSFKRGININSWLKENGFLALKDGRKTGGPWLDGVDWSKTVAYNVGLGGVFLNIKGREAQGIVEKGEDATRVKREIAEKLRGLKDPDSGETAVVDVLDTDGVYQGPYCGNAPDIIVGYNVGYRVSWDSGQGIVDGTIFEDNTKSWSGDHCIHSELVPGIFVSTLKTDKVNPHITDVAPTVLKLLGVDVPGYMDGEPLV